ncbi:MAG: sigma 54-interacting transcriptional regulator [Firmicutes bacterium]|nr:sigma 54-interacting transcriptional regulator [Bacillota bacterium]
MTRAAGQLHEQAWLREVIAALDVGVHAVDAKGRTIVYNRKAAALDGLDPADVIGRHVLDVFPSLSAETSSLLRVLASGETISHKRQTYRNFRGKTVVTSNTTRPVYDGADLLGALEVAHDITEVEELAGRVADLRARTRVVGGHGHADAGDPTRYGLDDLLTVDPKVSAVKEMARQIARASSPVLVYGETGVGKEVLVQGIHRASLRARGPFIAQNCAALPGALLEGILFGTVRGSFTGSEDRPGLFELASGGTLFLDELNAMAPDLQAKLLRAIEEQQIRRLGAARALPIDVRIIAAMNEEPDAALRAGRLRQDLYYRIRVVALNLPPLREREGDVDLLTDHFVRECNRRFDKCVVRVDPLARTALRCAPWPGNVRELAHAIEAAMIVADGACLELQQLPAYLRALLPHRASAATFAAAVRAEGHPGAQAHVSLPQQLEQLERKLIEDALRRAHGRVATAARALGVPRQTLQSKMHKLGLDRPS